MPAESIIDTGKSKGFLWYNRTVSVGRHSEVTETQILGHMPAWIPGKS